MLNNEDRAAWLETRKNHVTASDVAAVMGMNPHKTRKKVFEEKVGLVQPANIDFLPMVMAGKHLESGIFSWYLAHRGIDGMMWEDLPQPELDRYGWARNNGVLVHPTCSSLAVTPDGISWADDGARTSYVTEIKCVGESKHKDSWAERTGYNVPEDVVVHASKYVGINPSRLYAPKYYWAQLQAQMSALRVPQGRIVVCFGGQSRCDLQYSLDKSFESRMLESVTAFMEEVNAYRELHT